MASMNTVNDLRSDQERIAWNQAYARLQTFLDTFMLSDQPVTAQLALRFLDQARARHRENPSQEPTNLVMEQTQKHLIEWLAQNLDESDKSSSQIFSSGCIALFLSRMPQTAPAKFLASPLPDNLRQSMRETLLITGPDFHISSMTPRNIDYGPMLHLARQTWHRWNSREIFIALCFWIAIYFIFYWWLSSIL